MVLCACKSLEAATARSVRALHCNLSAGEGLKVPSGWPREGYSNPLYHLLYFFFKTSASASSTCLTSPSGKDQRVQDEELVVRASVFQSAVLDQVAEDRVLFELSRKRNVQLRVLELGAKQLVGLYMRPELPTKVDCTFRTRLCNGSISARRFRRRDLVGLTQGTLIATLA